MSQRTPRQELTGEKIQERFRQDIASRYARLRQQRPELKDDASHEEMVRAVLLPKLELTPEMEEALERSGGVMAGPTRARLPAEDSNKL